METYEVTQKLLSFGPSYEARAVGADDVLASIRGKLLALTPKLTMVAGEDGAPVAELTANWTKTKFAVTAGGKEIATLAFPLIALKKSFTIAHGDRTYKAEGGFFGGEFKCVDEQGTPAMVIAKQLSFRDKFAVSTSGALPREVALLAAVAIDQKFFQDTYADID